MSETTLVKIEIVRPSEERVAPIIEAVDAGGFTVGEILSIAQWLIWSALEQVPEEMRPGVRRAVARWFAD